MTADLLYRWPASAHFGRVVPKTKFYEHGKVTTAGRDKFVAEVQRITWAYKLADSTIHLRGTNEVPEIQVFALDAKDDDVSESVLMAIDKAVQFPIIFEVSRCGGDHGRTRMAVAYKQLSGSKAHLTDYFSTEWIPSDAERSPLPTSLNLPGLYAALIAPLLPVTPRPGEPLVDTAARVQDARKLKREIATLERRLRNEPQFNRKVDLRRQLQERVAILGGLTSQTRHIVDEDVAK